MNQQILSQGAEAIIYLKDNEIIKDRIKKSYRIQVLDEKLRKSRTKSEAKIINKLSSVISVPKIIKTDEKQQITMEYIPGKKLSEHLEQLDYKVICKQIAENISKIHNQNIVHGDLTTSNMIYVEDKNENNCQNNNASPNILKDIIINDNKSAKQSSKGRLLSINNQINENKSTNLKEKVYFIDFGLAFHSQKIEDKAVDLHLLQQALEARHFTIWQECWKIILDNYKADKHKEILQRIKVIESRGRYKDKY